MNRIQRSAMRIVQLLTLSLFNLLGQAATVNILFEIDQWGPSIGFERTEAGNFLLEQSDDLVTWRPYIDVYSPKTNLFGFRDKTEGAGLASHVFYKVTPNVRLPSDMLAKWRALGLTRYRFTLARMCLCIPGGLTGTITVENGQVVAVDNGQPSYAQLSDFPTIDGLFDFAIAAFETNYTEVLAIQFDHEGFYPHWIYQQLGSESTTYIVTNFEILP